MEDSRERLEKIKRDLLENVEGEKAKIRPITDALMAILNELIIIVESEKPKLNMKKIKKGLFR